MPKAMTHDEGRGLICVFDFKKIIPKESGRIITETNYAKRIRQFWQEDYNPNDPYFANGICAPHRNLLLEIENKNKPASDLPPPIDYSLLKFPAITRSSGVTDIKNLRNCDCDICVIARDNPGKKGHAYGGSNQGRYPNVKNIEVAKPFKICHKCWQVIGRGIRHPQPCSKADRSTNMAEVVNSDEKAAEKMAASTLKKKQAEAPEGATAISLATGGNKQMQVPIQTRSRAKKCLYPDGNVPVEEIQARDNAAGLTQKQSKIVNAFNRSHFGRASYESDARKKLSDLNKSLSSFFDVKSCKMDSYFSQERLGGKVDRHVAFCNDIPGLINHLINKRGYHAQTRFIVKIYIDGGGDPSSLKVSMTLEKIEDDLSSPSKSKHKWSYEMGVASDLFKDSGIMRLQILSIVENVNESQENLETLLDLLKLDDALEGFVRFNAWDMKVRNLYFGIGTNSSTYPCTKCILPKRDFGNPKFIFKGGTLRTLGSIRKNAHAYQEKAATYTGKGKLSSAEYKSCEKPPLSNAPNEKLVLELDPFMVLHNILGIVNDLYNLLDKLLENFPISAADWAIKALKLKREKYFGGNFKGNECDALLNNLDVLEQLLKDAGAKTFDTCSNLLNAFKAYKVVKDKCFGLHLDPEYERHIQAFGQAWLKLKLKNCSNKAHDLFVHAVQFLELMESKGFKKGLGYYSEHVGERVHSAWDEIWTGQSRQMNHPDYPKVLLNNLVRFNSKRVGDARLEVKTE